MCVNLFIYKKIVKNFLELFNFVFYFLVVVNFTVCYSNSFRFMIKFGKKFIIPNLFNYEISRFYICGCLLFIDDISKLFNWIWNSFRYSENNYRNHPKQYKTRGDNWTEQPPNFTPYTQLLLILKLFSLVSILKKNQQIIFFISLSTNVLADSPVLLTNYFDWCTILKTIYMINCKLFYFWSFKIEINIAVYKIGYIICIVYPIANFSAIYYGFNYFIKCTLLIKMSAIDPDSISSIEDRFWYWNYGVYTECLVERVIFNVGNYDCLTFVLETDCWRP